MGITIRVVDGADRGRVFDALTPPVTIGREEGNSIQLNDERVSRYHIKIQDDHDRLVLTDLESTNGTKVNGEEIQLRILRFGDMISVGRSVLLFGSRQQINERLGDIREDIREAAGTIDPSQLPDASRSSSFDLELNWGKNSNGEPELEPMDPPDLPERLSPGQAAQLAELIEYVHIRIRYLLNAVQTEGKSERMIVEQQEWQSLMDLQARLAEYLRKVVEPDSPY